MKPEIKQNWQQPKVASLPGKYVWGDGFLSTWDFASSVVVFCFMSSRCVIGYYFAGSFLYFHNFKYRSCIGAVISKHYF